MVHHTGTRTLHTERLILRRFTVDDAEDMYKNWAWDIRVTRYLGWGPHREAAESRLLLEGWAQKYEQDTFYSWGIVFEGRLIGAISVNNLSQVHNFCEVGYCIGHDCWGKGVMTEALQAVLDELFLQVGIRKVYAYHDVENPASGRVMLKCGMEQEARLKEHYNYADGRISDALVYGILSRDRKGGRA